MQIPGFSLLLLPQSIEVMKKGLFILLLLISFTASGQDRDNFLRDLDGFFQMRAVKALNKIDTSYVVPYPYRFDARLFGNTSGMHIVTQGLGDIDLSTGMSNRVGVSFGYRDIALSYSLGLGKTLGFDFGFTSYGKHLCLEYDLKATDNLTGQVTFPDRKIVVNQGDELTLVESNLNLFYSFNSRFSLGAAMKQSAIQRRSAGSVLAGFSWTVWDVLAAGREDIFSRHTSIASLLAIPTLFYHRFSVGAGYGYNLVLDQSHWLLHASVVPMWTFYDTTAYRIMDSKTRSGHPMGKITFTGTARAGVYYRWGDRWSLGLSGVVNQMASRNKIHRSDPEFQRFGAQEWQARLSLSYRF